MNISSVMSAALKFNDNVPSCYQHGLKLSNLIAAGHLQDWWVKMKILGK